MSIAVSPKYDGNNGVSKGRVVYVAITTHALNVGNRTRTDPAILLTSRDIQCKSCGWDFNPVRAFCLPAGELGYVSRGWRVGGVGLGEGRIMLTS